MEQHNDQLPPRLSPEAQNALSEFITVFKEAAEAGPHAFCMTACIGATGPGGKPEVAIRLYKQGDIDQMAAFRACMSALGKRVSLEDTSKKSRKKGNGLL